MSTNVHNVVLHVDDVHKTFGGLHALADIDLAVEGLAPADYFMALAGLYTLVDTGVEIDLVPIETAQPLVSKRIFSEGEILYAAKQDTGPDC